VYELNKVDLMKDVFIGAYARSAEQYVAVRQSLGEPNPLRIKHDTSLRQIISEIVARHLSRKVASNYIASWTKKHLKQMSATASERWLKTHF
jgi:hypothetical protein